jgi:hypothetical protein
MNLFGCGRVPLPDPTFWAKSLKSLRASVMREGVEKCGRVPAKSLKLLAG